jgi:uncharacterized protein (DUF342 family)
LVERQRELLSTIPELQKRIDKLKPLITLLKEYEGSDRLTPEKKEALEKANYSYMNEMSNMSKAKQELDDINRYIHQKGFGHIVCTGSFFPGVKVVMGQETFSVSEVVSNARIYYDKGTVCLGRAR